MKIIIKKKQKIQEYSKKEIQDWEQDFVDSIKKLDARHTDVKNSIGKNLEDIFKEQKSDGLGAKQVKAGLDKIKEVYESLKKAIISGKLDYQKANNFIEHIKLVVGFFKNNYFSSLSEQQSHEINEAFGMTQKAINNLLSQLQPFEEPKRVEPTKFPGSKLVAQVKAAKGEETPRGSKLVAAQAAKSQVAGQQPAQQTVVQQQPDVAAQQPEDSQPLNQEPQNPEPQQVPEPEKSEEQREREKKQLAQQFTVDIYRENKDIKEIDDLFKKYNLESIYLLIDLYTFYDEAPDSVIRQADKIFNYFSDPEQKISSELAIKTLQTLLSILEFFNSKSIYKNKEDVNSKISQLKEYISQINKKEKEQTKKSNEKSQKTPKPVTAKKPTAKTKVKKAVGDSNATVKVKDVKKPVTATVVSGDTQELKKVSEPLKVKPQQDTTVAVIPSTEKAAEKIKKDPRLVQRAAAKADLPEPVAAAETATKKLAIPQERSKRQDLAAKVTGIINKTREGLDKKTDPGDAFIDRIINLSNKINNLQPATTITDEEIINFIDSQARKVNPNVVEKFKTDLVKGLFTQEEEEELKEQKRIMNKMLLIAGLIKR